MSLTKHLVMGLGSDLNEKDDNPYSTNFVLYISFKCLLLTYGDGISMPGLELSIPWSGEDPIVMNPGKDKGIYRLTLETDGFSLI